MEKLTPLKSYTPPQFPTIETMQSNPELLSKLPQRWQKFSRKAAIAACVGIISFATFATSLAYASASGNSRIRNTRTQEQLESAELQLRTHFGGSGFGPFYVVSFTEGDAFGFILGNLEAAGLSLSRHGHPDFSHHNLPRHQRIHYYDSHADVGITFFHEELRVMFERTPNPGPQYMIEMFAEKGVTVGVFPNPDELVFHSIDERRDWQRSVWEEHGDETIELQEWLSENRNNPLLADEIFDAIRDEVIAEAMEPARSALIDKLNYETQSFIDQLQAEGILPSHENRILQENGTPQEITVKLNEIPLVFDVAPIIVEARTLVPMRAIFEALNFAVEWIEETQTINAIRNHDSTRIEMQIGNAQMRVSNLSQSEIDLDVPPRIVNGRTLVPLRAISTAVGANVYWDEETRTVSITKEDSIIEEGDAIDNLDSTHSITRTFGGNYQSQLPQVFLTYNDFNQYLNENWAFTGTWSGETPNPNYAERLRRSEDFFNDYFIVTLVIVEGSGSISHRLDSVDYNGNINMTRFPPGDGMVGTADMAQWLVEIELSREHVPTQFRLNMTNSQR